MKFGEVNIFVSQVRDGNMSLLWGEKEGVLKNRDKFFEKIGVKSGDCVYTSLVHGKDVLIVGKKDRGETWEADGFITREKEVGIFMLTGDCLPVTFWDQERGIVGLAHLGWRGVNQELAGIMVEKLVEVGALANRLQIWIGPGVRKESYLKYDRGVLEFKQSVDMNKWKAFVEEKADGRLAVDLVGYVVFQVMEKGVLRQNIEVSEVDTIANKNYFSQFRSDLTGEPQGRFATVVIRN